MKGLRIARICLINLCLKFVRRSLLLFLKLGVSLLISASLFTESMLAQKVSLITGKVKRQSYPYA